MKILKDIGTIGFADISSAVIASIFWLYLASIINSEEYGEIQFFISFASIVFMFGLLGNRESITVYEAKNIEIRKFLFTISLIGGTIASLIVFFYYQRFDIILFGFGIIFAELSFGFLLGNKFFRKYAILMILQKILMVIFGISGYFLNGEEGVILGIGLSYLPLTIIVVKGLRKTEMNISLVKNRTGFIINNYILLVLGNLKGNLDKIIIVPFIGFAALGNFSLAFQMYMILMVFSKIIYKYALPHESDKGISNKFKIISITIAGVIAVLGAAVSPILIPIFFPNFIDAIEIIPILSLAVLPNTIGMLFRSKYLGKEKSSYVLGQYATSTGMYILLIVILTPEFGLFGVAISFLFSSITNVIYYIAINSRYKEKKIN